MTPATGTALILLVAFVLPGFVVVLFQERTFKQAEDLTPFDRLLRTVYYSVWCYLIFGVDRASIEHLYHRYRGDPAQLVWRGALAVMARDWPLPTRDGASPSQCPPPRADRVGSLVS